MKKHDWSEFVELIQRTGVRISNAQRDLIIDADQHIDWLESRKRFSEAQCEALTEQRNALLAALLNMLYHYETGHDSNPEIIRARAAVAAVLGEDFDTAKAIGEWRDDNTHPHSQGR